AGVTDYLQKESGTDQYIVLANRIQNLVAKHRAETAVESTRNRFQRLIENSSDAITVVDREGNFNYLSPSSERVLGYEPEALLGENGFEKMHPDDLESTRERFVAMVEHPDYQPEVEFRFEQRDGSWRWLSARGQNLLEDPVIEGIVVNVRDVTERIEREQELRASERRFRNLAESATDVIITIDAESTIQFANPAVERVFGYSPEEVEGKSLTMLMPERYHDRHTDALNQYLQTGERRLDWTHVALPGLHKEGHEIDFQMSIAEANLQGDHRFTGIIRL
ncbi:MAG: PAS domain S-box protein, partial [Halobacteriales archaeon]|nr:PAS domain S-box protein [Halobacteriales archaeon]